MTTEKRKHLYELLEENKKGNEAAKLTLYTTLEQDILEIACRMANREEVEYFADALKATVVAFDEMVETFDPEHDDEEFVTALLTRLEERAFENFAKIQDYVASTKEELEALAYDANDFLAQHVLDKLKLSQPKTKSVQRQVSTAAPAKVPVKNAPVIIGTNLLAESYPRQASMLEKFVTKFRHKVVLGKHPLKTEEKASPILGKSLLRDKS